MKKKRYLLAAVVVALFALACTAAAAGAEVEAPEQSAYLGDVEVMYVPEWDCYVITTETGSPAHEYVSTQVSAAERHTSQSGERDEQGLYPYDGGQRRESDCHAGCEGVWDLLSGGWRGADHQYHLEDDAHRVRDDLPQGTQWGNGHSVREVQSEGNRVYLSYLHERDDLQRLRAQRVWLGTGNDGIRLTQ